MLRAVSTTDSDIFVEVEVADTVNTWGSSKCPDGAPVGEDVGS